MSLDSVYHSLNRTVLFQLCRPHKTVAQQVALLDALRVLTVNRNLVLGPGNHDQEFIACLAHCFICLHTGRYPLPGHQAASHRRSEAGPVDAAKPVHCYSCLSFKTDVPSVKYIAVALSSLVSKFSV